MFPIGNVLSQVKSCWPGPVGSDPKSCSPNDPEFSESWNLWGFVPDEVANRLHVDEKKLGSIGIAADRAWQYNIGRDDVVIAVLDSGILWNDPDLANKIYLNAGELPFPEHATTYDANGDGIFNVQDYKQDQRVGDKNRNGILDAQDLILAFSAPGNGYAQIDNDRNGYVDDIAGFDFFQFDSDPNDDTAFGHGTNQGRRAAAETNNGFGEAGVCPRCRILPVRVGDSYIVESNAIARGIVYSVRAGAEVIHAAGSF